MPVRYLWVSSWYRKRKVCDESISWCCWSRRGLLRLHPCMWHRGRADRPLAILWWEGRNKMEALSWVRRHPWWFVHTEPQDGDNNKNKLDIFLIRHYITMVKWWKILTKERWDLTSRQEDFSKTHLANSELLFLNLNAFQTGVERKKERRV